MDRSRYEALLPMQAVDDAGVLLIGVGGLNSYVGSSCARLGVNAFELIDPDIVEEANVGTQDYIRADIGVHKVDAMCRRILAINTEAQVLRQYGKVPEIVPRRDFDVMVTGPDNMAARQASFQLWKDTIGQAMNGPVYVDHRMGATSYELHVLSDPYSARARRYEEIINEDTGYAPELCGARAIAFTGMHAGARVGAVVASVLKAKYDGKEVVQGEAAETLSWPPLASPYRGRWDGLR